MNPIFDSPAPTQISLAHLRRMAPSALLVVFWLAIGMGNTLSAAERKQADHEDLSKNQVGFIRIIHAVSAGDGKATFQLDGADLFPKGYQLGQATGGIGVTAGTHEVEISRNGAEPGSTQVVVKPGETTTLIGFSEVVPQINPTAPPVWKIRVLRLRQSSPQAGFQLSLVSVCPEDETVVQSAVAGSQIVTTARVQKFRISTIPLGRTRAEVFVRAGPDLLTTVSPDSPGNYVVVLYRDATNILRAISFFDPKFVIAG